MEEEEIVDVGPATMIAEEVDDTSEEVASQLMQQAEKEKEILAMKIAELEEAMIEREEQLQSMHDQRLADAARKEEELEKERARQAEMEKQLHAEKERISARLVEEEAAMKKREAEQVAAREEAFRSKMAQLEEEHNRAILEYQTKMKSFESAMEEKAKFAADAETRAKEEEQRRARIEIETAEREALRIKEMEEHKLRLADIAAAAQEERLKREAVEMKSAELRAKNEKTQRDLQEQQRRAREDEKRRQEEDAARLASMEEVSRQLRARVQTAERRIEGKWTVTIPKYQLRQSSSGEYEAFEVNIRLDSSGWKVFRRYSEFESLHKLLKGMVPSVVPHIKLPGKGVFKSHDQRFLEKRRADLEVYLNDLVAKTLMLPESPFFARDRTSLMSKVPFFRPGDSLAE